MQGNLEAGVLELGEGMVYDKILGSTLQPQQVIPALNKRRTFAHGLFAEPAKARGAGPEPAGKNRQKHRCLVLTH